MERPLGALIAIWTSAALEADHKRGIYHWPTTTGVYCPRCLIRMEARS